MTHEAPDEEFRRKGWRVTRFGDRYFMERFNYGMAAPMQRQELTAEEFAGLRDRRITPRKIEQQPFLPPWLAALGDIAKVLLIVLLGILMVAVAGLWAGWI